MIKLNFNPTKNHLINIKDWLVEEWNDTRKGFYLNWSVIDEAFNENRLSVIVDNDYVVGFVVYGGCEFVVDIHIAEIKPTERGKGIGKQLIKGTLNELKQRGFLVAKLFCQPEKSEGFWSEIGFMNYPKLIDDTKIYMFKPLVETLEPTKKAKTNSIIQLWNCEPCDAKYEKVKWIWDLIFKEDNKTLINPIILPVLSNWQVELILNGEKLKTTKLKCFRIDLCGYPGFMIIRKIVVE